MMPDTAQNFRKPRTQKGPVGETVAVVNSPSAGPQPESESPAIPVPWGKLLSQFLHLLSHFPLRYDLFHGSARITPLPGHQQPPGQDAARGAKEAAPRCQSCAPSSFRSQGHQSATEGKEAGRKGFGDSGVWLVRPDPGAGKVTSVVKVEQILPTHSQSQQRAPLSSRREQQDPRRVGALRGGAQPGDSRSPGSLWDAAGGGRGLPGSAQVSAAVPPSPGEGPSPSATASRGAGTTSPPTPTPGRALLGSLSESPAPESQSPRAAPKFLHQAAPNPLPRGLSLSPVSSPRPVKVWPQPAGPAPPLTCGKRSLSARRAGEQGVAARARSSSRRPSRPGCRLNCEGRRPPLSPAHSPTRCVTRAAPPPPSCQVPARGGGRSRRGPEGGPGRGAHRGGPASPLSAPAPLARRPERGPGLGTLAAL
ncbi:hypothetical protein QTO34_013947, partial [Cnephaeus nilssonii]